MKGIITFLAYGTYWFMGAVGSLNSVALLEMGASFRVDSGVISYWQTFGSIGTTLAVYANGYLLNRFSPRKIAVVATLLAFTGYLQLALASNLIMFGSGLLLGGIGIGLMSSAMNYLLVATHDEQERTGKLILVNFFYSFSAILTPLAAGWLLAQQYDWRPIYQACLVFLLLWLFWSLRLPTKPFCSGPEKNESKAVWPLRVYLAGATFILYVIAEVTFFSWLVVYLREIGHLDVKSAGIALSLFWACMACGRLTSGVLARWLPLRTYLAASLLTAAAAYCALLLTAGDRVAYFILIGIAGLACSGMYASLLAFGTQQVETTTPAVVSFFIGGGSMAGIFSGLLGGFLKQSSGVEACLALSAGLMLLVVLLFGVTRHLENESAKEPCEGLS